MYTFTYRQMHMEPLHQPQKQINTVMGHDDLTKKSAPFTVSCSRITKPE